MSHRLDPVRPEAIDLPPTESYDLTHLVDASVQGDKLLRDYRNVSATPGA